jgi:hypothetical protein
VRTMVTLNCEGSLTLSLGIWDLRRISKRERQRSFSIPVPDSHQLLGDIHGLELKAAVAILNTNTSQEMHYALVVLNPKILVTDHALGVISMVPLRQSLGFFLIRHLCTMGAACIQE